MRRLPSRLSALLVLLPMAAFYFLPVLYLFTKSIVASSGGGLTAEHYLYLFHDVRLRSSLLLTIFVACAAVLAQVGLALLLALLCLDKSRSAGFLARIVSASYFVPTTCVLMVWISLTDPFSGPIAMILKSFDVALDLRNEMLAPALTIVFSTFEGMGFCFLLLLATLLQIPNSHLDLFQQFGRSSRLAFTHILWPHIRQTIYALIAVRLFISISKFDAPWLAFARLRYSVWGDTFGVWVYRNQFETGQIGVSSAGVVLFFFGIGIYVLISRRQAMQAG